ncbi:glycosyltransferase [Thermophagus sp. OGC60D27]|uniref:glycosyltransferase n=1 Tax=Thermophagus sp. OGC60D27 TaxID=3458415 RepID=UPI0040378FD3
MIKDLVSVIIPVKNRSNLFSIAFNSVVSQTYRPIEIIVVDDGSSKDEFDKINYIIQNNPLSKNFHIQTIRNTKKGAPAARNLGYQLSQGEYIQFFDSDDVLLPTKIETEVDFLKKHTEFNYVYSKAQYIDEQGNLIDNYWGKPLAGNSSDYFNFSYQTMCALYRRTVIEKFGGWDESLLINQDWELSIRYILMGAKTFFIDNVHSNFRVHHKGNIGKTDRKPDIIWSKFIGHKKIFDLIVEKGKNDSTIKKLFLKRFIYIYLVTVSVGSKKQIDLQAEYIIKTFQIKGKFLATFVRNKMVAKLVLRLYQEFFKNRIISPKN